HRGVDHLVHNTLVHFGGNHRCRGVGAHAAGIGAGVIVADPFVVLAGGHGQDVLAVHHDDEAGFLAFQELFDHHPMAGGTKGIAGQHILDRLFRFLLGHGDDDAFAGRQAIGLDHDGRTFLTDVGQGLVHVGEVLVVGRGDLVASQEVFSEGLGAFQLGGRLGWAEDLQAFALEVVHDTFYQWGLRAHDGQGHAFLLGEVAQPFQVQNVNGDIANLGLAGGAGIAWRYEHLFHLGGLGGLPGQGMFPSAAADNQYFHVYSLNLVAEVTHAGEHHGDAMFVGSVDYFLV